MKKVMIKLSNIKALNIEAASSCTARCPFCSRQQKVRDYGAHRISFSDIQKLPQELMGGLRRITFAGNFGDLSCNPEMVDIVSYIKGLNEKIVLGGETNAAAQKRDWWYALGNYYRDGMMVFAVDGLADTHSLHRVGTDFDTVIGNIRAFTSSGGQAAWKFILFEHNEHQIKPAEKLAQESGCNQFIVVSSRDYNDTLRKPKTLDIKIKRDIFRFYKDESVEAACKPLSDGSLYIAADGTVHPCCFAHCMYITEHNQQFRYILPLIERYKERINFKTRQLEDIITGRYFQNVLTLSKTNSYCRTKCNAHKKKIRQKLVLYHKYFQ
jgi:MoaA/NifB/PqqE/SkfB family radical SAM enzyme